jgi:hypothetical protein
MKIFKYFGYSKWKDVGFYINNATIISGLKFKQGHKTEII